MVPSVSCSVVSGHSLAFGHKGGLQEGNEIETIAGKTTLI